MYLRASEKASGVENFHSAVGSKLIRRGHPGPTIPKT